MCTEDLCIESPGLEDTSQVDVGIAPMPTTDDFGLIF
jgi:hypothetical protein